MNLHDYNPVCGVLCTLLVTTPDPILAGIGSREQSSGTGDYFEKHCSGNFIRTVS
ncbi:hypothetical protein HanHA300_Chr06g0228001 [Helianthus annuus]|nr:hypothetical protein HanHA300_Chr06g0228001 [Helianthus annuus]KAJ0574942.1 hypothetical protein HanHA89_Chr06g0243951 [Helianthus annuus]KAJ0739273.1 hypothetical protein HanLR1_Chr06g0228011 [Helianthus annuus]